MKLKLIPTLSSGEALQLLCEYGVINRLVPLTADEFDVKYPWFEKAKGLADRDDDVLRLITKKALANVESL